MRVWPWKGHWLVKTHGLCQKCFAKTIADLAVPGDHTASWCLPRSAPQRPRLELSSRQNSLRDEHWSTVWLEPGFKKSRNRNE